jgi:hypothetical protein
VGIPRSEFPIVTVRAVDELAAILERLDRRISAAVGIDPLETVPTPNLDSIRRYLGEVRAQAEYEATAHLRLEAEQAAARKAEAEMWQDRRQNAEALVRAGLRPR